MSNEGIDQATDDWRKLGSTTEELFVVNPGLQIAHHPDPGLIGAEMRFVHHHEGAEYLVARHEGLFMRRGQDAGRTLDDTRISRSPLKFRPSRDKGVELSHDASKSEIEAGGRLLGPTVVFSQLEISRGVALSINRSVVLMLHRQVVRRPMSSPDFGLVGESLAIRDLRRQVGLAMATERPILLLGASGTGKELVAKALHEGGPRASKPFVSINMATIPAELAASELFGHEKGAFSGAGARREGVFQRADGGTLFLDEIGDTAFSVQTALLRALETGEVRPVGSERQRSLDLRVIAATDVDIHAADDFKAALVGRLGVEVRLPSLVDRREDIPRLFHHFLRSELGDDEYKRLLDPALHEMWLPAWLLTALIRHNWPRNVRELRNVAREIAIFSTLSPFRAGPMVSRILDGLAEEPVQPAPEAAQEAPSKKYRAPEQVGRGELVEALRAHDFGVTAAARSLGLSQQSMYRALDAHSVLYAKQLDHELFMKHYLASGRDLAEMSRMLEISKRALKLRKRALGID